MDYRVFNNYFLNSSVLYHDGAIITNIMG